MSRLDGSDILDKTNRPTDLSTVMGVGIDKIRPLRGESTAITETRLENYRWAEGQTQELMRKYNWSREEAVAQGMFIMGYAEGII